MRLLLPVAIHSIALAATLELTRDWVAAWILVGGVVLSAAADGIGWFRERRCLRKLVLVSDGVQIDTAAYQARHAWVGPAMTAFWLTSVSGRRRLLYVMSGEVTPADHAALRRHAKHLEFDSWSTSAGDRT